MIYRINDIAKMIHKLAIEKGWWEHDRNIGEILSNIHAEVSEAWEEYRSGKSIECYFCDEYGKPEGFFVELADVIIRILDLCAKHDVDIEQIILEKHEYNKTRPYKHGGKIA